MELSLNSQVEFLISVTQSISSPPKIVNGHEDLTIHMKIILTSVAIHYSPFFSGLLQTDEKKWCLHHPQLTPHRHFKV